jgi:hypothetical protein
VSTDNLAKAMLNKAINNSSEKVETVDNKQLYSLIWVYNGIYKEINVNRQRDISLTTAIRDILLSFKNKKELKFFNNLTGTGCHSSKHLYQKLICETY